MAGPEARFVERVHRQLDRRIYKQSMTGVMGNNGTPDRYYEGSSGVLWIEYKAVAGKLPKVINLIEKAPKLSPLQLRWINRADFNDVPVAVVLGSEQGGLIFTGGSWDEEHQLEDLKEQYTPAGIAEFIAYIVITGGAVDNWQS